MSNTTVSRTIVSHVKFQVQVPWSQA